MHLIDPLNLRQVPPPSPNTTKSLKWRVLYKVYVEEHKNHDYLDTSFVKLFYNLI